MALLKMFPITAIDNGEKNEDIPILGSHTFYKFSRAVVNACCYLEKSFKMDSAMAVQLNYAVAQ